MIKDQVKYVWLDEDGEHVSPMHNKFGSALNFINGWHDRYARLVDQSPTHEVDLTRKHSFMGYQSMSKSGKPPVKLVRAVVRVAQEDLSQAEQAVVDAYMEATT